jgi:hypothetical protein
MYSCSLRKPLSVSYLVEGNWEVPYLLHTSCSVLLALKIFGSKLDAAIAAVDTRFCYIPSLTPFISAVTEDQKQKRKERKGKKGKKRAGKAPDRENSKGEMQNW